MGNVGMNSTIVLFNIYREKTESAIYMVILSVRLGIWGGGGGERALSD